MLLLYSNCTLSPESISFCSVISCDTCKYQESASQSFYCFHCWLTYVTGNVKQLIHTVAVYSYRMQENNCNSWYNNDNILISLKYCTSWKVRSSGLSSAAPVAKSSVAGRRPVVTGGLHRKIEKQKLREMSRLIELLKNYSIQLNYCDILQYGWIKCP